MNILKVFDETKARTGCKTCSRDYQRKYAKSFDASYKYMLSDEYGKVHGEKIGDDGIEGPRNVREETSQEVTSFIPHAVLALERSERDNAVIPGTPYVTPKN